MIGFSVPRKARSASKRSHDNWVSFAGATPEQTHRQASPSPSPAPISPSSSNVSVRKKLKPNGSKQKPPKSSSKASSSNPEELEIEIAEVLYGLMTQSQAPPKREIESAAKFDPSRPNDESKSRVSSPISNSASTAPQLPQNSGSSTVPFSAVAPKRKKPRQVLENQSSFSARNSPISSTMVKSEIDQPPKIENLLPNQEKTPISVSETNNFQSLSLNFAGLDNPARELPAAAGSPEKETPAVKLEDSHDDVAVTKVNSTSSGMDIQREEKFEIDLMAPPPQLKSSPERASDVDFDAEMRKDEKACKSDRDEMLVEEPEPKKAKSVPESAESEKATMIKGRNIDLQLDLEKPDRDNTESLSGNSKSHPHVQKQQQPQVKVPKDEHPHTEKAAQTSSLPLPMSLASWPGGLPPMGYMAPLQGVVSIDGSQVPPTPVQPLFTQPRPKRCATHCYIARNIHCLQQFMKMNPFWPASAGPASLFGANPCNLNVIPSTELHDRAVSSVQDKGPGLTIFPGHVGKEKASQPANIADAQRKQQQILLQQALPAGAPPSNMLHGPAFIFPFNQQQAAAAVAAASVRPGPAKSASTAPNSAPISASTPASVNGSAATAPTPAAVSFNYPNMPSNETQYLAILQNNAYPFPIRAPTYRGAHPQPVPFFNGSFYTSQMIHPSQLQQPPSSQQQIQPGQQNASISNGSSSSQKQRLQSQQQRPEQGTGNLNTFPAPKNRPAQSSQPLQARNIETEAGNQDSSSTADSRSDSRSSRGPVSVYGQNFSMPIHHQNFALVSSTQALAGTSNGNNTQGENKKQHQSQHQGIKPGGPESLPPTFAMSFASMNGGNTAAGGIDLSSVAQNHAVFQNFSEADRRNYQAAVAQVAQQRKNFRVLEEGKNGVSGDSSNMDEEKKGLAPKTSVTSGQSIAFTRQDLTDPSASPLTGTNVVDSSARNLNMASSANNQRGSRNSITNTSQLGQLQNVQFQQQHMQQQMVQMQKQQQLQQQFVAARNNKIPHTSNGSVYGDHLTTSSPSAGSKFPNSISGFPQNLVQSSGSNSPSHSPQWKASARGASQVQSSSTSSLKNLPQQQQARPQQSHTQISFGSGQKPQTGPGPHGQQQPSTHQSSSPPMGVSSPTTSLSKGAGGSPRTPSSNSQGNKASSLSCQQSKNPSSAPTLKTPSILGNPHNITSSNSGTKSLVQQQQQQHQQQLKQMANNQPQLFFSTAYMQTQPPQSTSNPANTSGYYLQRRYPEKQQQQQQQGGSPSGTSTGMLSLCTPVTVTSSNTTEAKAGAGTVSSNTKGPSQSILHQSQFQAQSSGNFSYVHTAPAGVQVKPTTEQKQPAGNRESVIRK